MWLRRRQSRRARQCTLSFVWRQNKVQIALADESDCVWGGGLRVCECAIYVLSTPVVVIAAVTLVRSAVVRTLEAVKKVFCEQFGE